MTIEAKTNSALSRSLALFKPALSCAVDCRDAKVVQDLYRDTGRAAISKVERLVGRFAVAQEIVQDVFLKLWQQQLQFASAKQAYFWIYKSAHHAGIDHLRAAVTRRERLPSLDFVQTLADAADLADASSKRQLVARLLAVLDARDAAILCYTVVDGMTQDEVAELLALSRKTVNRTLVRLNEQFASLRKEAGDET